MRCGKIVRGNSPSLTSIKKKRKIVLSLVPMGEDRKRFAPTGSKWCNKKEVSAWKALHRA